MARPKFPEDIIICPVVSEKAMAEEGQRIYVFEVADRATKVDIRKTIEGIYGVQVKQVRTVFVKSKPKRFRSRPGRTCSWKKAYVSLRKGFKLDVY